MMRNSWLVAIYALFALSSAFNLDAIDGVAEYIHHGKRQQASGTGNDNSATPSATPNPEPSSPAPSPSPTPAPSTPDQPASTPASTPAPSSPQPSNTPQSSADAPVSSRPASSAPRTTPIVRTSLQVSTSLQEFVTVFTTISNGQPIGITSTGTRSVALTSPVSYTDPPDTQNGGGSSDGLSDGNKKVIGGVVGGVGGVLLLGGIALVFWRMKKRQHKVTADDDDLNLNTGAALGNKEQPGTGASPFQSNLEQYHNPGGRPNAAANF